MEVKVSKLKGAYGVRRKQIKDERGYFMPSLGSDELSLPSLDNDWVVNNIAYSHHGVLRGMHYQNPSYQAKLITLISGQIQDVIIDLRKDSETYMQWDSFMLSESGLNQVYVPRGFAHGFLVTGEHALISYLADAPYRLSEEQIIGWDDPRFNIAWLADPFIVSLKDS